ncbi:indole-3-glycerol phosphate synthase-domain-containing protein [Collybia nuda]|uniref:Multifunctional tryptophan biosynthesis protein n=1 Tax=Collybia nuda TaxID=64659 RepID=A0A9P6CL07_9AGAR|nr:indole-3-glycerol phosphate synthase-domain-containing protein [Collybia nuda]
MSVPAKQPTILETIYAQRAKDVDMAKSTPGATPADLAALLSMHVAPPLIPLVSRLKQSPSLPALMAEIKRASPSKGAISLTANPAQQALTYALSGASVISVLTEPTWFKGSLLDMRLARQAVDALPNRPAILRKEFILDEYQIAEARLHGADTVLLIVAMLSQARLAELYAYSLSLGMEPLVEVNNASEMKIALDLGSKVIGVNNRNLHDFQVDMGTTSRLVEMVHEHDVILCALSGISGPQDVQLYREQGVRAVLIGEALMRAPNTSDFIRELLQWSEGKESDKQRTSWVQATGITSAPQAVALGEAGVDMLGIIFDTTNPQHTTPHTASQISAAVRESRFSRTLSQEIYPSAPTPKPWFTAQTDNLMSASRRPLLVGIFTTHTLTEIIHIVAHAQLDLVQLDGPSPLGWINHIQVPVVRTWDGTSGDITCPGFHAFARVKELQWARELEEVPGWPMPFIVATRGGGDGIEDIVQGGKAWAIDLDIGAGEDELERVRTIVKTVKNPRV